MKPKVMELMHTMHKLNKLRLQIPPPEGGGAWGSLGKPGEAWGSLGKPGAENWKLILSYLILVDLQ